MGEAGQKPVRDRRGGAYIERELLARAAGPDAHSPAIVARMLQLQRGLERAESVRWTASDDDVAEQSEGSLASGHSGIKAVLLDAGYPEHEADDILRVIDGALGNQALALAAGLVSIIMSSLDALGTKGAGLRHALGLSMLGGGVRAAAIELGCSPQRLSQLADEFGRAIEGEAVQHERSAADRLPAGILSTAGVARHLKISTARVGKLERAGVFKSSRGVGCGLRFKQSEIDAVARQRALDGLSWADMVARAEAAGRAAGPSQPL